MQQSWNLLGIGTFAFILWTVWHKADKNQAAGVNLFQLKKSIFAQEQSQSLQMKMLVRFWELDWNEKLFRNPQIYMHSTQMLFNVSHVSPYISDISVTNCQETIFYLFQQANLQCNIYEHFYKPIYNFISVNIINKPIYNLILMIHVFTHTHMYI